MVKSFDYEKRVQKALTGVVQDVLTSVSQEGLPGQHHFYITFQTHHRDVRVPKYLLDLYPLEMTIAIQHQFDDLKVNDQGFEITLTFSKAPESIWIPFSSLMHFLDPSVDFSLYFEPYESNEPNTPRPNHPEPTNAQDDATQKDNVVMLDAFRKKER